MRRRIAGTIAFLLIPLLIASDSGLATTGPVPLTERQKAQHVLNRLAFGPRPGDVEELLRTGIDRWIERQLHPEAIEDQEMEAMLARFETLEMSESELFDRYERPVIEARRSLQARAAGEDSELDRDAMRREIRERIGPDRDPRQPIFELTGSRILRAVHSERQLEEVLVDFWMNHFNVFAGKGPSRALMTSYERDVIRPHIWGTFEDLLLATAQSPAMLFYLDNARSVAEMENRPPVGQKVSDRSARSSRGRFSRSGRRAPKPERLEALETAGLNENYARELMELHTLGVDGGYTQKDVTELARLLTGWSLRRPEEGGEGGFVFRAALHDARPKSVMGVGFSAGGGLEEGERMIGLLARHPSTASHLARKLCQRLIGDDPPPALVERIAKVYGSSGGNLRATVEAIVTGPEFFDPVWFRAKVKTPFEYVVSAVRATGADVDLRMLAMQLREMGQPLYL
ncbi:MAG TPA: DUF1800 domain-containing protein, partial [Thermoanaerobaculia bacterium]|nr:DUF1800 domain-containing protein [Thermoanaerobaculia bacterium]